MTATKGTKAVAYVRVSTSEQAQEGWSLGAQRKRVKAYCEARGWKLAKVYADEGVSAKGGTKRPEFERMVREVLADGVGIIVALKLDRLGRSAKGLLDLYDRLERKGVAIVTIDDGIDTSTAHGRFFRTVLAGVAEFERDLIAQRTRTGVRAAMEAGKRVGRAPYGYHVSDGVLVPHSGEQDVAARIRALSRDGMSLAGIATALNAEGIPSRAGRWHATSVARIVAANTHKASRKRTAVR
ncbi:MAG: recombinase family protein [Actinomycetota bacterium]